MKIHVLGSSGSEGPDRNPPAFLIDDFLLLDAGTVAVCLDTCAQCGISHILLTHAHLDHIKGIPFLVDNVVLSDQGCRLKIVSGKEVIADLKRNIFNGRIWPDFTLLPYPDSPVMSYETISSRGFFMIDDYKIYATKVRHRVPTYGYMIIDPDGTAILYPGDTGPTERIWKRMRGHNVKALIVGVSFPDEMMDLALISGHLTPSLLKVELTKMPKPPEKIYVTHIKPHYQMSVENQLSELDVPGIEILRDRMTLFI